MEHSVITRVIRVAKGVFAPGHLGELTRIVPFEMVDEVLAATGRTQQRLRLLPSRVVVYLLLAAGLFAEVGYLGVWDKLVAGLDGLGLIRPSGTAVWQARIRVGVAPLRALFDLLRGSAAGIGTVGVWWCGLLVAAIDGTVLDVPDSPGNAAYLGRNRSQHGTAGYRRSAWSPWSRAGPGRSSTRCSAPRVRVRRHRRCGCCAACTPG